MVTKEEQAFDRGAWFAFDVILSWINTQTEQHINKADLYRAVMIMRPAEIARYKEQQADPYFNDNK